MDASGRSAWDEEELRRVLSGTFIRQFEYHAQLTSTNDRALALAGDASLEMPLLVYADRQLRGRGRGTNRWWAAPGALTFSVLLDSVAAGLSTDRWPLVSLATGLAVCEALREILPASELGLKWPNDVHLAGRKVGGILVEPASQPSSRLVIGIGVNVNNSLALAPAELSQIATSLSDANPHPLDLGRVLAGILGRLERRLLGVAEDDPELCPSWQRLCVLTGREVEVLAGARRTTGQCLGIDPQGALLVETSAGPQRCLAGTVRPLD